MRKASAQGTPDQMIAAVQKQIDMLSGSPSSVQSTTSVKGASAYGGPYGASDAKKYIDGKLEFYGNEIEMDFGDGLELARQLKEQGKEVMYDPEMGTWSIPGCHWGDCYFYPYDENPRYAGDRVVWDGKSSPKDLEGPTDVEGASAGKGVTKGTSDQMIAAVEKKVSQLGGKSTEVESSTGIDNFPTSYLARLGDHVCDKLLKRYGLYSEASLTDEGLEFTIYSDSSALEVIGTYSLPAEDIDTSNEDYMAQDIAQVSEDIYHSIDMPVSASTEVISSSDRDVSVTDYDTEDCYIDTDGCFGDCGDTISMKDIKDYWNSNSTYDPCLAQYDDFQGWWADIRKWLKQVNCSDNVGVEDMEDEYIAASAEEGIVNLEDESAVKRYLHILTGEVITSLNDSGITEHIVEAGEGDIAVCVIIPDNGFAVELAVPCDDLKWDWSNMSADVSYIVDAVKEHRFSDEDEDEDEDDDIYLATAVTASYSPDVLDELVNYYSQFELSSEEIWDQIVAQYEDEDLADDVLEALGR